MYFKNNRAVSMILIREWEEKMKATSTTEVGDYLLCTSSQDRISCLGDGYQSTTVNK